MKTITEMRTELSSKAAGDKAFRQSLIADPKGTVAKEYNLNLPEDVKITVLEDTPTMAHLILTQPQKLSDADLRRVTGMGGSVPEGPLAAPY